MHRHENVQNLTQKSTTQMINKRKTHTNKPAATWGVQASINYLPAIDQMKVGLRANRKMQQIEGALLVHKCGQNMKNYTQKQHIRETWQTGHN
jgi:hypothetical protein